MTTDDAGGDDENGIDQEVRNGIGEDEVEEVSVESEEVMEESVVPFVVEEVVEEETVAVAIEWISSSFIIDVG